MSKRRQRRAAQPFEFGPQAPPAIRLINQSVQTGSWRDPDDTTPNARRAAREITGFRAACALRRMLHRNAAHSQITENHVIAADLLRLQVDAVLIGFSGRRELMPVQSLMYGPLAGPSVPALRSVKAWKPLQRALALFSGPERRLLFWVVLHNRSVRSWCEQQRELAQRELGGEQARLVSPDRTMQTLVELLDRLAAHYDVEDDRRRSWAA